MQQPQLIHGGDWAGYLAGHGAMPLDFSANISPLGVPEGVRQAIAAAAAGADLYPDPLCRALTAALAGHYGLPQQWLLCGNGAADLIYRAVLARRPRRALVTAPTFAEYENALRLAGCAVQRYALREQNGFVPDEGLLQAIRPGVEMVFLCEPNNPTGRTTPMPLLQAVLARCAGVGAVLVVDECFNAFLDQPAAHTLAGQLGQYPNLVLLRAFTKLWGMAGVRLGWCACADEGYLEAMRCAGPPWAVSALAQAAGLAALQQPAYVQRVRALTRAGRAQLAAGLAALGCTVVPGEANYLLFASRTPLCAPLRGQGILLRDCANYAGLPPPAQGGGWYRTAVRTRQENARLLAALAGILQPGQKPGGAGHTNAKEGGQ